MTYFPYVDKDKAAQGEFHNKYFGPLREVMEKPNWILMFVKVDGYSFIKSVLLARRFIRNGERMAFVEEFIGFNYLFFIFFSMIYNWFGWFELKGEIHRQVNNHHTVNMIKRTFVGVEATRNIFHLLSFTWIFARVKQRTKCFYLSEMQSWETALCGAANEYEEIHTLAYQHTATARAGDLFKHSKFQMENMPLPDRVLCDGPDALKKLEANGWKNVKMVESLRYLHLLQASSYATSPTYKRLLVVGGIDREETKNLISLLLGAISFLPMWDIHFKTHPSCYMPDSFFGGRVKICGSDLDRELAQAHVVLVRTSSVAAEALAYGCDVIVPKFDYSEGINVVEGYEGLYRRSHGPHKLIDDLNWSATNGNWASLDRKKKFVKNFWCLDKDLPRWREILEEAA